MDEDIAIINQNTRNEKIINFFVNNKKKLIIIFLVVVLAIFSYFIYIDIKKKTKIELANRYNIIQINFISGDKSNVKNELISIINEKDRTYSPLALYFLIDNNIINEKNKINKFFDIIIDDISLEKEMKNLIIYKKALFNSDFESENNLIQILKPIINSNSVWKSHSLYLMGEYFFSKNERQKAKDFFIQIIKLENANPNIKKETRKKLNRDFSD